MREIKFRGKRIDNGEWVYGFLFVDQNGAHYILDTNNDGDNGRSVRFTLVQLETVGQNTGLNDKNGTEIYEGDIIKQVYHAETGNYDDRISFDGHHIGEVIITATKGACMKNPLCYAEETDETTKSNQYKSLAGYRCEVIGNIYEHPHLLDGAAK